MESGCEARGEVAADICSPDQKYVGLALHNGVTYNLCVGIRIIDSERRRVIEPNPVGAVAAKLFCGFLHVVAEQQRRNLAAELVGKLAGLGDELEIR